MILSERFRFVFIKGMKVAGTSVEMALAPVCGPDDVVTPISGIDELERIARGGRCRNYSDDPAAEAAYLQRLSAARREDLGRIPRPKEKYFNHMSLAEVMRQYQKPLGDFRIVCVERSPYSKVLSWLNMKLSYQHYATGSGSLSADPRQMRHFMDEVIDTGAVLAVKNIDRYRDADGRIAAQAMRYENLAPDFDAFLETVGAPRPLALPHAKKGLMADAVNPRDFLRPDQIARLNAMFADEFAAFCYPTL